MRAVFVGALLVGAACALNPAPVPVAGANTDIDALVGEWTGEYRSVETGRSGSILFVLEAGRDTAHGDVVMVARETGMTHDDAMRVATTRRTANQVLTIRFVRVTGTTITGTIDPYPSPDCSCQLITVFRGELRGDRIEGSFRTHHSEHETVAQQGTWWATRSKK
jgi:hypothetical protein